MITDANKWIIEVKSAVSYLLLSSLYYQDKKRYEEEYRRRTENEATISWIPTTIGDSQAFFQSSKELLCSLENIYTANNKITRLFLDLPQVAIYAYIKKSIIDEIVLSNGIEGIHSTRKEIRLVLAKENGEKRKRFSGIARKYKYLLEEKIKLENSQDIRQLYNDTLAHEIDKKDQLDGLVFRREGVFVIGPTGKTLHKGVTPESLLIEKMDAVLSWMKEEKVPYLVRVAAFHYFFGYLHPFYDGNGRMSRLITSSLFTEKLNLLVSFRLSQAINIQKQGYYKGFDLCNNPKNKGDITPFILIFFAIIEEATQLLIKDLTESKEKLDYYCAIIVNGKQNLCLSEQKILFIVVQNTLFNDEDISTAELIENKGQLNQSPATIRKYLKNLVEKQLIVKEKCGKEMVYRADFGQIDKLVS